MGPTMTDEELDEDALRRLRRAIEGLDDRVRIIDTGRPGRIGAPRHRLLALDKALSDAPMSR